MSQQSIRSQVERALHDTAFRQELTAKGDGTPTAYDVEQRMSKAFTIDPGGAGSPSISVQSPDAIDRNLMLGGAGDASAVQSPDAAERNLILGAAGDESLAVQSPDAADRNLAYAMASESVSGAVQSPDAIERNLVHVDGSHLAPTYGDGDLSQ